MTKTGACDINRDVTLVKPLSATHVANNPTCDGVNDGSITIIPDGGSGKYTYHWYTANDESTDEEATVPQDDSKYSKINTAEGIAARSGLGTGVLYYRVEDTQARDINGNGKTADDGNCMTDYVRVSLVSENGFAVKGEKTDVSCFEEQNGIISINVLNGSGNYSYTWSGTGSALKQNENVQTGLSAGLYTVVVRDRDWGCTYTSQFTVGGPTTSLNISAKVTKNVTCNGGTDGEFTLSVSGGTAPYYWAFDDSNVSTTVGGANEVTVAGKVDFNEVTGNYNGKAGKHVLYVRDANGCLDAVEVNVTEPDAITLAASATNPTAQGSHDGCVSINSISGGTAPYTLAWYTGTIDATTGTYVWTPIPVGTKADASNSSSTTVKNDTRIIQGVGANVFSVIVTDNNGCVSDREIVTVTDNGALAATFSSEDPLCYGENGKLHVLVTNGKAHLQSMSMRLSIRIISKVELRFSLSVLRASTRFV